ncbi:MAG: 50S ribosomal protein L9 [Chitinophagaceae bacterium]|jgi:large subunit ribosomal protein L9|nr:50S ribosomal protein L9 [Chitinophagaceae bacterium]
MQIILVKDMDNLGSAHEVVNVRPGYARNYLIPQKFAVEASPSNLKMVAERNKVKDKKEAALLSEINKVSDVLKASPISIGAKTGTSGKIFGSVTPIQIARAIREQKGYEIDRKRISIVDEVKEIGTFKATIDFGNANIIEIDFEVVSE